MAPGMFVDLRWRVDPRGEVLGHSECEAMRVRAERLGWNAAAALDGGEPSPSPSSSSSSPPAPGAGARLLRRVDVIVGGDEKDGPVLKDLIERHRGAAIVGAVPTSERALQAVVASCCPDGRAGRLPAVDIIAIELHKRLPFKLRGAVLQQAIDNGVFFEVRSSPLAIFSRLGPVNATASAPLTPASGRSHGVGPRAQQICFADALRGQTARRTLFSNARALVAATRGRGIVVSSGARWVAARTQARTHTHCASPSRPVPSTCARDTRADPACVPGTR